MARSQYRFAPARGLALVSAFALALLGVAALQGGAAPAARGDDATPTSQTIDFDGYTLGDQLVPAGWYYQSGAAKADYGFVDTTAFPDSSLSGQALRISNAITVSGRQLGTPTLAQVAGVGPSAGEYNGFETSFVVASATGALQPGTDIEVSLDGGSGHPYERTGGTLFLRHIDAGLQVTWMGFQKGTTDVWPTDAVIVDAAVPHEIGISLKLRPGNVDQDIVTVSIDGVPTLTGVSWAGYYMAPKDVRADQGVGSLMFRAATSAPVTESGPGIGYVTVAEPTSDEKAALAGNGLLFTDISYSVSIRPTGPEPTDPQPEPPVLPTDPDTPPPPASTTGADGAALVPPIAPTAPTAPGGSIPVAYADGTFLPYEWVQFVFYSVPTYATSIQANAAGGLSASIPVPSSIPNGSHTLAATGTISGVVATAAVTLAALAETGLDAGLAWFTGTIALSVMLWGVVAILAFAAYRRRSAQAD